MGSRYSFYEDDFVIWLHENGGREFRVGDFWSFLPEQVRDYLLEEAVASWEDTYLPPDIGPDEYMSVLLKGVLEEARKGSPGNIFNGLAVEQVEDAVREYIYSSVRGVTSALVPKIGRKDSPTLWEVFCDLGARANCRLEEMRIRLKQTLIRDISELTGEDVVDVGREVEKLLKYSEFSRFAYTSEVLMEAVDRCFVLFFERRRDTTTILDFYLSVLERDLDEGVYEEFGDGMIREVLGRCVFEYETEEGNE